MPDVFEVVDNIDCWFHGFLPFSDDLPNRAYHRHERSERPVDEHGYVQDATH